MSSVPSVNFYIQYSPQQVTPPQAAPLITTGSSSSGSTTLTVASGLTVWTNSVICGPGIAAGTTVVSYSGTTVTLSQALTASVSSSVEFIIVGPQSSSSAWTGYSDWIEEINIRGGRQHYLDRMESSSLEMIVDNRTGAFSSYGSIIVPRLPIFMTATYNGRTYPIFNGIVESVDTRLQDQLNANIMIRATDNLKFLALKLTNNTAFYATYVPQANASTNTTGATNWYRMNSNSSFGGTLTDALTYNNTTAPYSGYNGNISGTVLLDQPGVLLYEKTTCADLTGGTGNSVGGSGQGSVIIPFGVGGSSPNAIDFWIIGQGTTGQTITSDIDIAVGFTAYTSNLWVNPLGQVQIDTTTGGTTTSHFNPTPVNDGLWHHIALMYDSSTLWLYVDGVPVSVLTGGSGTGGFSASAPGVYIGTSSGGLAAYIDEVVVSDLGTESNKSAILDGQIKSRYLAGRLLRQAQNSGDRIAEILVAGGFGSISISNASYPATVQVNPANLYVDAPWFGISTYAYSPGSSKNGTIWVQPMTSSVTGSAVQDLILQITDTECGNFHQSPAGMFMFRTRDYPYTISSAMTSQATLSDGPTGTNYDATSFDFSRDDVDTWTTVVVSPMNGTEQVYNTGLGYLYGDSTLTKSSTQNNDPVSAQQTANYLGYIFQSPLPRVTAVDIHSENYKGGGSAAAIYQSLNRALQDRITLYYSPTGVASPTWAPAANPTTNHSDFLIESIAHNFTADPGRWTTTFVLDPYPLRFDQQDGKTVGVFGSATFSGSYVFL